MPSATAAALAHAPMVVESATPATHQIQLSGEVKGTYTLTIVNPDVGRTYAFSGVPSRLSPLGRSKLAGKIGAPGMLPNSHAAGTLVIASTQGRLTLQVTGPVEPAGFVFPSVFNYTITRSTGRYKGDTGAGYIHLVLTPTPTSTPTLVGVSTGHFSMSFLSAPPS